MKTKEELLKIYSAYLPYQLNIAVMGEFADEERKIPQIFEMVGLDTDCVEYHELGRTITEQAEFTDAFPHLWSMDMLTKEIEHKGERFTPMSRFFAEFGYLPNTSHYQHLQVQVFEKLLEWHFNVFGLDESEYIKKRGFNP